MNISLSGLSDNQFAASYAHNDNSQYPIYQMVLQMEAMELHKLESIIRQNDGVILDRNTDAIRYAKQTEINMNNYYWDDEQTVIKYQNEDNKPLKHDAFSHMARTSAFINKGDIFNLNWKIRYDYDDIIETCQSIIGSKQSINIDDSAGTGKTFFSLQLMKMIEEQGKSLLSFSPTNKGARLIKGQTIHSLYYTFKNCKTKLFPNRLAFLIHESKALKFKLIFK